MKTAIRNSRWFFLIVPILFMYSCQKVISTEYDASSQDIELKVNTWLDNQKRGFGSSDNIAIKSSSSEVKSNSAQPKKNANIDLLKTNLEYSSAIQSVISKKYNSLIVPIKEELKTKKGIDKSATLSLVLITDKTGKIISGTIASYIPKDGKSRGVEGVQIIANIIKGKAPADDSMVKFMDVTGRRLNEIGFKKGLISSYGEIQSKAIDKTKSTYISDCTDWYLVTTYYDEYYNIIEQTTEFLGTTCTNCDEDQYGNPCPGGNGGSGGSNPPVISDYAESGSTEVTEADNQTIEELNISPSSSIAAMPLIKYTYGWYKNTTSVDGVPIYVTWIEIYNTKAEPTSANFIDGNGEPGLRKLTTLAHVNTYVRLTVPLVLFTWKCDVNAQYIKNYWNSFSRQWTTSHVEVN